jgi:hypothetical protein
VGLFHLAFAPAVRHGAKAKHQPYSSIINQKKQLKTSLVFKRVNSIFARPKRAVLNRCFKALKQDKCQ